MKRYITLILLMFLMLPFSAFSQQKVTLSGQILCSKTKESVIFAAINLKEIERWTTTDEHGYFEFRDVKPATYTIQISCLGYQLHSASVTVTPGKDNQLLITLIPSTFDMQEVNILAKKNSDIASTTDIGNAAIEHVQPTSLGDIMQLLPGNIAENPDLSKPQQISIREIGTDNNSASGTAIIVDGAPLSNDANLQTLSSTRMANNSDKFNTVVGGGFDLRQISTDNIESVEVIKGIPSVVYGNLTSGAVIVKTKAGRTPLELKLKSDPQIKQAAITKGFKLKQDHGFLNFDFDYLQSYSDLTSKYKGYNRATGDISYSQVFLKEAKIPLSFNASVPSLY